MLLHILFFKSQNSPVGWVYYGLENVLLHWCIFECATLRLQIYVQLLSCANLWIIIFFSGAMAKKQGIILLPQEKRKKTMLCLDIAQLSLSFTPTKRHLCKSP